MPKKSTLSPLESLSPAEVSATDGIEGEYVDAATAMEMLGVSAQTLYAYVSRKGIRSQPLPGTRKRRYWRADVERLRDRQTNLPPAALDLQAESEITLITDKEFFYRGRNAVELAESESLESVAALLWQTEATDSFGYRALIAPDHFSALCGILANESEANRVQAIFPLLEGVDPDAYEFSMPRMGYSGAAVLGWLAAIAFRDSDAAREPLHLYIARRLQLDAVGADLARRILVLSADHGFDSATVVARSMAAAGATTWRSVAAALSVTEATRVKYENVSSVYQFLRELLSDRSPERVVARWLARGRSVPGFGSRIYPLRDPRAQALLRHCRAIYGDDRDFGKLEVAIAAVHAATELHPNFALMARFCGLRLGLASRGSIFHLGRATGWIAHAIEQHVRGDAKRQLGLYRGPLPP